MLLNEWISSITYIVPAMVHLYRIAWCVRVPCSKPTRRASLLDLRFPGTVRRYRSAARFPALARCGTGPAPLQRLPMRQILRGTCIAHVC